MRKLVQILLLVVVAALLAGCDGAAQIQARTAEGIAQAANASLPILLERMRTEGLDELQLVLARGGSRAEAESVVAKVEARWAPIWKAWDSLRAAQDHWAAAIERGGDLAAALSEMVSAYCSFEAIWPGEIPAMPFALLRCPDE